MTTDKKYVAYYRVSKDSHESGRSISRQLGLDAQKQIASHFHKKFEKEFTEVKSAKNISDRPILQEAIQYCIKHNCFLVVAKLDRLCRNVDDVRLIVKTLSKKIIFCDIPSDGETDMMVITMYAAFAERERELISIRTKQALQAKLKNEGPWHHKSLKWQKHQEIFVKSGDFQKLAVTANIKKAADNENNIRATQLVMAKKSEGLSFGQIADILNSNKFFASEGGAFTRTQVRRIYNREIAKSKIAA